MTNFELEKSLEDVVRSILYMYWTCIRFNGLFDDFSTEDGTFDPFEVLGLEVQQGSFFEEDTSLIREGASVKILCGLLQEQSQGGREAKHSMTRRALLALEAGSFSSLPLVDGAVRALCKEEDCIASLSAIYRTFVLGYFERILKTAHAQVDIHATDQGAENARRPK